MVQLGAETCSPFALLHPQTGDFPIPTASSSVRSDSFRLFADVSRQNPLDPKELGVLSGKGGFEVWRKG